MADLDKLIFTGAEWKIFLATSTGKTHPLLTVDSIDMNISVEQEDIHAVGDEDPIGNKTNARKYAGKISMQAGEIMSITALEGLSDAARIRGATLACAAIRGGFNRTFRNVNITTENMTIARKAKETLVTMDISATANF